MKWNVYICKKCNNDFESLKFNKHDWLCPDCNDEELMKLAFPRFKQCSSCKFNGPGNYCNICYHPSLGEGRLKTIIRWFMKKGDIWKNLALLSCFC